MIYSLCKKYDRYIFNNYDLSLYNIHFVGKIKVKWISIIIKYTRDYFKMCMPLISPMSVRVSSNIATVPSLSQNGFRTVGLISLIILSVPLIFARS